MIFASKLVAGLAMLTSVALARSILEARSCKPNFQGNPLTVYKPIPNDVNDVDEWRPVNAVGGHITLVTTPVAQAFANGEFLVPFTGLADGTYNFKLTANTAHDLQLTGYPSHDLSFAPITSGTSQNFAIDCSSCSLSSPDAGVGCVVSHPDTGTCITGNGNGATLALAPCDGTASQNFNFRAQSS